MESASKTFLNMTVTTTRSSIRLIGEQITKVELVRQMLKDTLDIDIHIGRGRFQDLATKDRYPLPKWGRDAQFSTVDGEKSEVEVPDDLNMKDGIVPAKPSSWKTIDGWSDLSITRVSVRMMKETLSDPSPTRGQRPIVHRSRIQPNFTGTEALGKAFAMTFTNVLFFLPNDHNGLDSVGSAGKGIDE